MCSLNIIRTINQQEVKEIKLSISAALTEVIYNSIYLLASTMWLLLFLVPMRGEKNLQTYKNQIRKHKLYNQNVYCILKNKH